MTGFLALITPFIIMPSILNTGGTCVMDSIMLSMVYEYVEDNNVEVDAQELEARRDRKRKKEYGNMYGQQPEAVLKDAKKRSWITSYKRIHGKDYTYQENTILDMRGFRYQEPGIITGLSGTGELIPFGHTISIIGEVKDYYIGLTDKARGVDGFILVEKGFGFYYTYEL